VTSHTVTHCPHGLPLPGPCSLCADGLRAPGTDAQVFDDAAKLRTLATWFDHFDDWREKTGRIAPGIAEYREVQDDLRHIADGLRAPGTDGHVHQWRGCYSCDNGDLACECGEHLDVPPPDELRAPGTDDADYQRGWLDGYTDSGRTAAGPAWLGALLLAAALLLGAGIGWLLRGAS